MMRDLADAVVTVASTATHRLYFVCLVHLILCITLIATTTSGDELFLLGGVAISPWLQWAFGAFNCACIVSIIVAGVGNLFLIESHLTAYSYVLVASSLVDAAWIGIFGIFGQTCSRENHFSRHVTCQLSSGVVIVTLVAIVLFKILALLTTSRAKRLIRNKYSEALLPHLKESLGTSIDPAVGFRPSAATFAACSHPSKIGGGGSGCASFAAQAACAAPEYTQPAAAASALSLAPTAVAPHSLPAAESALVHPQVSQLRPLVASAPSAVTTYGAASESRPAAINFAKSAPPPVITGTMTSIAPPAMPAKVPPVSMPVLSRPIPSSLAHMGPLPGRMPVLSSGSERLLEPGDSDALCPALVLTRGESEVHFTIPVAAIQSLSLGDYPVEILGPSGRALLHARLPSSPSMGAVPDPAVAGFWLELCTTPTSDCPHGSVGPLFPGVYAESALEIRGSSGQRFGTLEPTANGWCVHRRGRALLYVELEHGTTEVKAMGADGRVQAVASRTTSEAMQMHLDSGVDALLCLLCVLAAVLMSTGQSS